MKKTIYVVTAVALASVILISLAVFNSAPPTQNTRHSMILRADSKVG
jgi:hypothetical protein